MNQSTPTLRGPDGSSTAEGLQVHIGHAIALIAGGNG